MIKIQDLLQRGTLCPYSFHWLYSMCINFQKMQSLWNFTVRSSSVIQVASFNIWLYYNFHFKVLFVVALSTSSMCINFKMHPLIPITIFELGNTSCFFYYINLVRGPFKYMLSYSFHWLYSMCINFKNASTMKFPVQSELRYKLLLLIYDYIIQDLQSTLCYALFPLVQLNVHQFQKEAIHYEISSPI
jgi:hypothetical protein